MVKITWGEGHPGEDALSPTHVTHPATLHSGRDINDSCDRRTSEDAPHDSRDSGCGKTRCEGCGSEGNAL